MMTVSSIPSMMKAAVYDQYGPPEIVRIMTIEVPVPRTGEFLVRVRASTVNRTDCVYVSTELGAGSQNPFLALITPLLGGKRVLFPIPTISKVDVEYLADLVRTSIFHPVIDRVLSLNDIVDAYRYVETEQKIGNVVIAFPD